MKAKRSQQLFVLVAVAVAALWVLFSAQAAEPKKIEIVIKDSKSKVLSGYTITGMPTEIVVRNEDNIVHGFNTSFFTDSMDVQMEGGSRAKGKGPHVYRIEPGKTLTLKLTPPSMDQSESFAFWCDIHASMKGEMLVVEYTGPGGG